MIVVTLIRKTKNHFEVFYVGEITVDTIFYFEIEYITLLFVL